MQSTDSDVLNFDKANLRELISTDSVQIENTGLYHLGYYLIVAQNVHRASFTSEECKIRVGYTNSNIWIDENLNTAIDCAARLSFIYCTWNFNKNKFGGSNRRPFVAYRDMKWDYEGGTECPDLQIKSFKRMEARCRDPCVVVEVDFLSNLEVSVAKRDMYLSETTNVMAYIIVKIQNPLPVDRDTCTQFRMVVILYLRGEAHPVRIVSCGTVAASPEVRRRLAALLGVSEDAPQFTGYGFDTEHPCTAAAMDPAHVDYSSYALQIPPLCMWAMDRSVQFPPDSLELQKQFTWDINVHELLLEVSDAAVELQVELSWHESHKFNKGDPGSSAA